MMGLCIPAYGALLDIYLINGEHAACPSQYYKVSTSGSLNGDFNQNAGGSYLYLCVKYGDPFGSETPIDRLEVVVGGSGSNCGGWDSSPHDSASNGDFNQKAGGDYVYLCYTRGHSHLMEDLMMTDGDCPAPYTRISHTGAGGGDFNRHAGGKYIFLCQKPLCLAESVKGSWTSKYTISSQGSETWRHGTSMTHGNSKTEEWSSSVTRTVNTGFELEGISASTEISSTIGHSTSNTYSQEWTTNDEHAFTVTWGPNAVGLNAWQFIFAPYDSCGYTEQSKTQQYALTEGAWRPPCCLPGYATDAPSYSKCHSADVMIPDGGQHCAVASTLELAEHFRGLNQSMRSNVNATKYGVSWENPTDTLADPPKHSNLDATMV